MGEEVPDWVQMWGAKVKMPADMRDDTLRDAIDTSREALDQCRDFEAEGIDWYTNILQLFSFGRVCIHTCLLHQTRPTM